MKATVSGNLLADVAVAGATPTGTIDTNAVTINSDYGVITTGALTTAADTWEAAVTFTNSRIKTTSAVLLTINNVTGAVGTNGVPHAVIDVVSDGSAVLRIGNIGTNALTGAFTIAFRVYNT
jgi:malic enzyme